MESEKKAQIQQETNAGKRTWFPSIVEKAPESYRSDQCFEIPRNATLKLDSIPNIEEFGEISADTIKKGIEIKYRVWEDLSILKGVWTNDIPSTGYLVVVKS